MSAAHVLDGHWMAAVPGVTRGEVASDCRAAGLAFLSGTAGHWGKVELATWLAREYARATQHAHWRPSLRPIASRPFRVDEPGIARISSEARWTVLGELETAALPHARAHFADSALAHGLVVPVRADDGIAWAPVDVAGTRLRSRVLSLFAADALARPHDYANDLYVCHRCETVTFDRLAHGCDGRHQR